LADANIDETCNYPSKEEIQIKINELETIRKAPKKK